MHPLRTALTTLLVVIASSAFAALGDPPSDIVTALASYEPQPVDDGFRAANDFAFELHSVDGVAIAVSGEATLTDANVRFLGALLGAASGYGVDIAGPIADFFRTRSADLIGAGEVPIQVLEFDLSATVVGPAPGVLSFRFEPQTIDESLFPKTGHLLGSPDADYVVRVFSDFQCPFCARFSATVLPLLNEELLVRSDVRFELHHFPLRSIHPNASVAAEAAECVADENGGEAFWSFHDALFEQQSRWSGLVDPVDTFIALAEEQGLETEGLGACLRSGAFSAVVDAAYTAASQGL